MFIETSAKAGYNVKQVSFVFVFYFLFLSLHCLFQLFRRVAAALPGMEADKKPPEDSKTCQFPFFSLLGVSHVASSISYCAKSFCRLLLFMIFCCSLFPYNFPFFVLLVTEIDLNNAPVETKPAEGGCAC